MTDVRSLAKGDYFMAEYGGEKQFWAAARHVGYPWHTREYVEWLENELAKTNEQGDKMQVNVVVELELKEVQNAILLAAKEKIGKDAQGGSVVEFSYDSNDLCDGARVKFQYQKK